MAAPIDSPPRDVTDLAARVCELGLRACDSDDPRRALDAIAAALREHCAAAFIGVALRATRGEGFTLVAGAAASGGEWPRGAPLPEDAGPATRAAADGVPVIAPGGTAAIVATGAGAAAQVAVPLAADGEAVGVLLAEPAAADAAPALRDALLPLAQPVALAVRTVQALERGRRRVDQLAVVTRVSHIVTSTVELDDLLRRTATCIREQLGHQLVAIGLVDGETQRVVLHAVAAAGLVTAELGHSQAIGEGVTGEVVQSGRGVLVPDVREWPNYVPVSATVRSEMCAPLRVGDRVIGCLDVESEQPGSFDVDDLELLGTIADHIAQAVQNARTLRQVARLREELAGMLVHDLRHPLTVILASLDVVAGYLKRHDSAPVLTQLRDARAACEEMLVQIGGLLDLQKLEAGALQARPRPCAAGDVVRAVAARLEIVAATRGVMLTATVADDLPAAWLDAELVTRVLENLVVNALKFTPAQGHVEVAVGPAPPLGRPLPDGRPALLFSVRDTGPGIPAADRERIFDRFVSGVVNVAGLAHSTGQGLAFCRRAAEAHGGIIWVDPEVAEGSTFHLLLPLAPAAGAESGPHRAGRRR